MQLQFWLLLSGIKEENSIPCHTRQKLPADRERVVKKFMHTKRKKSAAERKAKDEALKVKKVQVQDRLLALDVWRRQQVS